MKNKLRKKIKKNERVWFILHVLLLLLFKSLILITCILQ